MNDANLISCLVSLNRSALSDTERDSLLTNLAKVDLWELIKLAKINACQVLVYKNLLNYGLSAQYQSEEIFQTFSEEAGSLISRAKRRTAEAKRFLQACAAAGIEVILLKGSMLGSCIYKDDNYKKMNDIDFLVRPEAVTETMRIMEQCGFQSVGKLFAGQECDLQRNHHLSPYVNADYSCVLGLHWHLTSPYAHWKPDLAALWADKIRMSYNDDTPAYRMSWEHNLAHLCMHLPYYKLGLRELADVFNVILDHSINWKQFEKNVIDWKIQDPTWRVLSLARAWSNCPIPQNLLDSLLVKLEQNTRVDTEKRIRDGYRLLRSRSVHIGKIEKAFGLFRLSSRVSDRVQALAYMWLKTLWVPNEEIPYILAFSESEELRFTNSGGFKKLGPHLKACARIWNALARDYGHSALILMTLANHLSLIKSCLTALLPPYRKNHVTSLKELQNLLE